MTNSTICQHTPDSFSLQRVAALFAYYAPAIRRQVCIYLAVSILFTILLLIPGSDTMRTGFFSLTWTILQWMWYLSPLSMASKGRSGIVDRLIPAKALEKLSFFLIYFVVIIPLVEFTLPVVAELTILKSLENDLPHFKSVLDFQLNSSWIMKTINILSAICCCLVSLCVILKSRHNKMLFGILSAFCVQIILGVMGAILSGFEMASKAFQKGFEDGLKGKIDATDFDPIEFTREIIQPSPATYTVVGIITAGIVIAVALIYRRLRKPSL